MAPLEFVAKYKPYALQSQKVTGIHYHATLVQAALESGWGKYAVGNNFFGIKDTDGVNGNEQLITTTEVLPNKNYKFPVIISIVNYGKSFLYTVKDYFRKYDSIDACFIDRANFFQQNSRYQKAWLVRSNSEQFLREVAKAGYATDPLYEKKCIDTLKWFEKNS